MTDRLEAAFSADAAEVLAQDLPWHRFSGRRIVVTGAGGFVGGHLLRALLALQDSGRLETPLTAVAPVRSIERTRARLEAIADHPRLELVEWDFNSIALPDLGDLHFVIHAASQSSPKHFGPDPVGTAIPNGVGTAALLTALQASSDPQGFLFVSSGAAYGAVQPGTPVAEGDYGVLDPLDPSWIYGESKRYGETLCAAWSLQYGLHTTIGRLGHTYGAGLQSDDGRAFVDFAYAAARGEPIVLLSDGSVVRPYCYISDAVAGLFAVLLRGATGNAYNVSNPRGELSILELAELISGLSPTPGLEVSRRVRADDSGYLPNPVAKASVDVSKLEAIGWRATVLPEEGFRRMLDSLDPTPQMPPGPSR